MCITRLENESDFEYLLRLVLAKRNKEIKLDWDELAALLNRGWSGEYLRKLAYGLYEYEDYLCGQENKHIKNRILCISDTHVPFQLPIQTYEKYKNKIDTLVLNGDIFDMQSLSKFPKAYRVSPMEEIIDGRLYIMSLIEYLHPKMVVGINGNHEIRYGNYLAKHLDSEILELQPNSPMELIFTDGFVWYNKRQKCKVNFPPLKRVFENIEFVYPDNWYYQIGDTIFCHPLKFSSRPMETGNKAYKWFLENGCVFDNLIVAHTHKVGNYMIAGKSIYESGCCVDINKNNYTDGKLTTSQSCGFLYIEQNLTGKSVNIKQEWLK